jgi:hypothetical protein
MLAAWVVAAFSLCLSPRASALIAVKLPVAQIIDGSRVVVIGTVTKVSPDTGNVVASAKALKGTAPGESIKFKIAGLPQVLAGVKEGSPYVLLTGRQAANFALHLGDTWLLPEATDRPDLFSVTQEKDLKQSYPGTTTALIRIVEAKAAGKYDMLDTVTEASSKAMLRGGTKDLPKIDGAGVTHLITVRSPDKHCAVYGQTKDALKRLFNATPTGFDVDSSPAPAVPVGVIAISPGEYLSASGELTQIKGAKSKLWPDATPASAAAFGNFGEDDRQYALVIKDDDVLRYPLDGKGEVTDFLRMTGERVSTYHRDNPKWLAGATCAALDVNGDGRMDLLIHTKAGAMLLINRGYGAFFIDADIDKALKTNDGRSLITDKTPWTAVDVNADDLDDLIILSPETGAVTAVLNAKPADGK